MSEGATNMESEIEARARAFVLLLLGDGDGEIEVRRRGGVIQTRFRRRTRCDVDEGNACVVES